MEKRLKPIFGPNYRMDVVQTNGEVVGYITGKYEGKVVDVLRADTKKELEVDFKHWLKGYSPEPRTSPRLEDFNQKRLTDKQLEDIITVVEENLEYEVEGTRNPNVSAYAYVDDRKKVKKYIREILGD